MKKIAKMSVAAALAAATMFGTVAPSNAMTAEGKAEMEKAIFQIRTMSCTELIANYTPNQEVQTRADAERAIRLGLHGIFAILGIEDTREVEPYFERAAKAGGQRYVECGLVRDDRGAGGFGSSFSS